MAGEPVTGTVNSGVTTTSQAPVLIGGIDANGVARTLLVNSNGSLVVPNQTQLAATARGLVAETFSLAGCAGVYTAPGGTAATSGLQGTMVGLRQGDVVSTLVRYCGAVGASVTLSKIGLFTTAGVLLGVTADIHATLVANSFHSGAIAKDGAGNTITSVTIPADGAYYIACLDLASAGTAPTFLRSSSQVGIGTQFASHPRLCFNVNAQSDIAGNVTPADASTAWWFAAA